MTGRRTRWGAVAGVLAALVGLAVAEPVAAFLGPSSAPLTAVAGVVVDQVPRPVEEWAIRTFGTSDKLVLLTSTAALLAAFAALCGVVALRRISYGFGGIALFGVIGIAAAVSRPDAAPLAAAPTAAGAVLAGYVLSILVRRIPPVDSTADPVGARGAAGPAGVGGTAGPASSTADPSDRAALALTATDPAATAPIDADPTVPDPATTESAAPDPADRGRPVTGPGGSPASSRRRFLVAAGAVTAGAVVTGGSGRLLTRWRGVADERAAVRLPRPASPAPPLPPGADLRLPGLTPFHTPNRDFYRIDNALVLPQVHPDRYRLRIHGRVRRPLTLTFADLLDRPMIERDITIACVSNEVGGELAGTARWLGVPLRDLLDETEPEDGADQVVGRSADGWTCGTPTAACRDGRDAMLAVGMNGEPLPIRHGFPVRMIVPGLYGYVSATKWLTELELSRFADFDAYWVPRGWAAQAPIKTFSRIDTPRVSARVDPGPVTVAGVAWAQRRGVARVEVRVDGGPWNTATLAPVPSVDTWRQWRWEWDASTTAPGRHTLEVRATDTTGATQPERWRPPAPNGTEGWHLVGVEVR